VLIENETKIENRKQRVELSI